MYRKLELQIYYLFIYYRLNPFIRQLLMQKNKWNEKRVALLEKHKCLIPKEIWYLLSMIMYNNNSIYDLV